MNVEIKFINTVNKTVIEFNYITHKLLFSSLTGSFAKDDERLRRDGCILVKTHNVKYTVATARTPISYSSVGYSIIVRNQRSLRCNSLYLIEAFIYQAT